MSFKEYITEGKIKYKPIVSLKKELEKNVIDVFNDVMKSSNSFKKTKPVKGKIEIDSKSSGTYDISVSLPFKLKSPPLDEVDRGTIEIMWKFEDILNGKKTDYIGISFWPWGNRFYPADVGGFKKMESFLTTGEY